ncbi:MAG: hypothetical protein R3B84_08095 [Zavarzinella sp.]
MSTANSNHYGLVRIWQIPVFLLACGVWVVLWQFGDRLRPTPTERFQHALAPLRNSIDRTPPLVDQIHAALREMPNIDPPDHLKTETHYLMGSAYTVLAEFTEASTEADEWWKLGYRHLQQVDPSNLSEKDRPKYLYRYATSYAHLPETDPKTAVEQLEKSVVLADDPSEGHLLLSRFYQQHYTGAAKEFEKQFAEFFEVCH